MRSLPVSSLKNCQVLSTVITLPSLSVRVTLPIEVAVSPAIKIPTFLLSTFRQPFKAKPLSFGNAGCNRRLRQLPFQLML